jgi:RNA polymerase sigma-70 factor (ECF subfamily)
MVQVGAEHVVPGQTFEEFFRVSRVRVLGALLLITRDRHLAEDASQEAYHRAYRDWDRISALDRPDMWVLRVASNIAVSRWRRRRRETALPEGLSQEAQEILDGASLAWGLSNLSPRERAVILLHYAEGWPVEDVAQLTNQTHSAVRGQLYRARRRLRHLLRSEGEK